MAGSSDGFAEKVREVLSDPQSLPQEFQDWIVQHTAQNPVPLALERAPGFQATGLTGSTASSRYVGATTSGAPASGIYVAGDFTIDQSGSVWICTAAGSPGTWAKAGSSPGSPLTRNLEVVIDGGGSVLTTGIAGDIFIDFACTIKKVTMLADQSGSIVVDIWKAAYGSYPPTVANTITASDIPTISTATKSQDSTLTGWTTSISAGDCLRFNINSVTSIKRVLLALDLQS